jgi:four helix bundle protein
MPTVECFEDLRVWQEAREVVRTVYRLSREFPAAERYGLASQMQRAAVSTMSNIAEGFERGTTKELIRFLYIAKGSNGELRSQTYAALDLGYVSQEDCDALVVCCKALSRGLYNFIEYLKRTPFKGPQVREPGPDWGIEEPAVDQLETG